MNPPKQGTTFYSHGKLLLTGEYLVLDGALALAVPTAKGQSLTVESTESKGAELQWYSYDVNGEKWFQGRFALPSGRYLNGSDEAVGRRLEQLFRSGQEILPGLWEESATQNWVVSTDLEFPRDWGLGTSSTLIVNLAKWWNIDPYLLLEKTFGGSGYDLACADAGGPLFYQLIDGRPQINPVSFDPVFVGQLFFLFLEQKQNSRSGIASYRKREDPAAKQLQHISEISRQLVASQSLSEFRELLEAHESLISEVMGMPTVKERVFPDFPGTIKSLGAWGGDFVLIASDLSAGVIKKYFSDRGFSTLIGYSEMVL